MAYFLAAHPSQIQTSVSLFILSITSPNCSANACAVLPDSPRPTNSNTQPLLDDDDPPLVSVPKSSSSSMLIERPILCSQLTYFDSLVSKGFSFVSNGLLSSRPSESNPDVGQFVYF